MSIDFPPSPGCLTDVIAAVRDVLREPDVPLSADTSLEDIPGWDSMDLIAVVVELECRFDILFELPELDSFYRVGDLVRGVSAKCGLQPV